MWRGFQTAAGGASHRAAPSAAPKHRTVSPIVDRGRYRLKNVAFPFNKGRLTTPDRAFHRGAAMDSSQMKV